MTSKAFLALLIVGVYLSPRIRLPFLPDRAIDLRVQDLLILPALAFAITSVKSTLLPWRSLVVTFGWAAATITLVHEVGTDEVTLMTRMAFLGRALEPFILAAVICRLALKSGSKFTYVAVKAFTAAIAANVAWIAYQVFTGSNQTMFGTAVASQIESYGPRLIGEPSAFGCGALIGISACLVVAAARSGYLRSKLALLMLSVLAGCAYLVQSRIWVGAILLLAASLIGGRKRPGTNAMRVVGVVAIGLWAIAYELPSLPTSGRLSVTGVEAAITYRIWEIWKPLIGIWLSNPKTVLIGVGPGGIDYPGLPAEAHNIALRSLLDFGLVGGSIQLATLIAVYLCARRMTFDSEGATVLWAWFAKLALACVAFTGMVQDSLIAVSSSHLLMIGVGLFAARWIGSQRQT